MVQMGSVFFAGNSFAQQRMPERSTSELGISVGGITYKGEVAPRYRFLSNRPALMVFYKRDFSRALSWRGSLLLGRINAQDEQYQKKVPLAEYRKATVNTSVLELSGGIDYNFLDYYDFRRRTRWTPYFTVGAAAVVYNNKTTAEDPNLIYGQPDNEPYKTGFAFAVPVGAGVKYALSHHLNLGFEFGARAMFTDDFDNLSTKNEQVMNRHDNDWYFYNGISISYTFYRLNCPQ